mmetsp:Transcript_38830/g.96018  ORF Transcript_38830/g.96018 Transcript_38830/m.96018 type:complete len:106 (-) Transcript_38830:786-1103(-)
MPMVMVRTCQPRDPSGRARWRASENGSLDDRKSSQDRVERHSSGLPANGLLLPARALATRVNDFPRTKRTLFFLNPLRINHIAFGLLPLRPLLRRLALALGLATV